MNSAATMTAYSKIEISKKYRKILQLLNESCRYND